MISNQRPLLIQTQQEMFENPNCQPDKKGFLWGYIWSNVCSCCSRGVIVSWRGVKPKKGLPSTPRPWKPMLGGTESHSFRWTARRVIVFEILFLFIVRIIDKSNQRLWGWKKKKKRKWKYSLGEIPFHSIQRATQACPASTFKFQREINFWAKYTRSRKNQIHCQLICTGTTKHELKELVVNLLISNEGCLATCERTAVKIFRVPGNNRTNDLRNALTTEVWQSFQQPLHQLTNNNYLHTDAFHTIHLLVCC